MTAENTEPNDAPAAEDLRARYLPVSRKELRRQREAELAQKRRGKPRAAKPVIAEPPAEVGAIPEVDTGAAPGFTTGTESEPGADTEAAELSAPEQAEQPAEALESAAEEAGTSGDAEFADDAELALPDAVDSPPSTEVTAARPQDLPGTERDDQDEAPVPASRKARRSLRVTENIAALSEDRFAELQELTEAVVAEDDPHHVDPELLKKQQALAARAMQANQERRRKEQAQADRAGDDPEARSESELITRKTLRTPPESQEPAELNDRLVGSIEPVQARGAHGLEMDAMVEHSTRQGARQSMIGWLVIILAVLLIIAVGVVLSFIL